MSWWQFLLFPFAIIYDIITRSRNWLYDINVFKSVSFDGVFVLCVGNLSVGGTGKTPMVEYLIRLGLENGWKIATLSRGYGRKTKGVVVADSQSSAEQLGDESYGYMSQFGEEVKVVVAESRVEGMAKIKACFPEVNVVILDDAFQHRSLKADFYILLTTFARPFWRDFLLPMGRLRESRIGRKRADFTIVTKCSSQKPEMKTSVEIDAFTTVKYDEIVLVSGELSEKVFAVAGIANNQSFFDFTSRKYNVEKRIGFTDHHSYTQADVERFMHIASETKATLLCTFKDYVKLKDFPEMSQISWGYIPIKASFLDGEDELKETLKTQFSLRMNTGMES